MSNRVKHSTLSPSAMLFRGSFVFNPVLVQVIGICPIVAATVSLSASALMAAITVLLLIICETLASVALKGLPAWVRVAIYFIIGLAVTCPVMYYADYKDYSFHVSIGIYFPLLAVSSLTALRCEKFAVKNSFKASFIDAVGAGIGYSVVFLIVGVLREFLGNGTIGGKVITQSGAMPAMLMTFGGFIVLGMLSAIHKAIVLKFFPAFEKDMDFKIKMTTAQASPNPVGKARPAKTNPTFKTTAVPTHENDESVNEKSESTDDSLNEGVVYTPDLPKKEDNPEEPYSADSDRSETSQELSDTVEEHTESIESPTVVDESRETTDNSGYIRKDNDNNSDLHSLIVESLNKSTPSYNKVDSFSDIDIDSMLEEDFEQSMKELFEEFKKRHNLGD